MKFNPKVTRDRNKQRKMHFAAPSSERYVRMAAPLSKELRQQYDARALPVRREDEVEVVRGNHKGTTGKIVEVYRKKYCIHLDKLTRDKMNGSSVYVPLHPSKVVLTSLHLNKDRKRMLASKSRSSGHRSQPA
jgi:large subunit ribosomal protein L26e